MKTTPSVFHFEKRRDHLALPLTVGDYRIAAGCLEAVGGRLFRTKESFGNCQIHLEWMAPANFKGPWYDQGNNGVMLMGLFEIQVFDSWSEKIYPDGQAAAIYGQTPPLVNATRKPGEWQTLLRSL